MCLQSHKEQQGTRFVRVKRGKKVTESPSTPRISGKLKEGKAKRKESHRSQSGKA